MIGKAPSLLSEEEEKASLMYAHNRFHAKVYESMAPMRARDNQIAKDIEEDDEAQSQRKGSAGFIHTGFDWNDEFNWARFIGKYRGKIVETRDRGEFYKDLVRAAAVVGSHIALKQRAPGNVIFYPASKSKGRSKDTLQWALDKEELTDLEDKRRRNHESMDIDVVTRTLLSFVIESDNRLRYDNTCSESTGLGCVVRDGKRLLNTFAPQDTKPKSGNREQKIINTKKSVEDFIKQYEWPRDNKGRYTWIVGADLYNDYLRWCDTNKITTRASKGVGFWNTASEYQGKIFDIMEKHRYRYFKGVHEAQEQERDSF
jgi:hypothetical protein